jgi:hypothetical protein
MQYKIVFITKFRTHRKFILADSKSVVKASVYMDMEGKTSLSHSNLINNLFKFTKILCDIS